MHWACCRELLYMVLNRIGCVCTDTPIVTNVVLRSQRCASSLSRWLSSCFFYLSGCLSVCLAVWLAVFSRPCNASAASQGEHRRAESGAVRERAAAGPGGNGGGRGEPPGPRPAHVLREEQRRDSRLGRLRGAGGDGSVPRVLVVSGQLQHSFHRGKFDAAGPPTEKLFDVFMKSLDDSSKYWYEDFTRRVRLC